MSISVNINGVWREVEAPFVNVGGAWQAVQEAYVRVNGVWQIVFEAISDLLGVMFSRSFIQVSEPIASGVVTSGTTTVLPQGGNGQFTYSWSRVSGDTEITITNPTSRITAFRRNITFGVREAVFRCLVTDTVTGQTASNNITVSFEGVFNT